MGNASMVLVSARAPHLVCFVLGGLLASCSSNSGDGVETDSGSSDAASADSTLTDGGSSDGTMADGRLADSDAADSRPSDGAPKTDTMPSDTGYTSLDSAGCSSPFADQVVYPVGPGPRSMAVADFSGDGKPDLAVATSNSAGGLVSVLVNEGSGTFATAVSYAVGGDPTSVATGDFNGDGQIDLAVSSAIDGTVSVLLNLGSGTFAPAVPYTVATGAFSSNVQSIVVGDFDSDGKPDLAAAVFGDKVYVLLNRGGGTFAAPVAHWGGVGLAKIAIGDFDGDGKPDLVATNETSVSVLVNAGSGTFAAPVAYPVWSRPTTLVVGDFNGDSKPDLTALVASTPGVLSVLLNEGSGTFAEVDNKVASSAAQAAGDFDGDGKLDLALTDGATPGHVSVLVNHDRGIFTPAGAAYPVGGNPRSVAVGDFNGDGKPDIVAGNQDDNMVSVLLSCAR